VRHIPPRPCQGSDNFRQIVPNLYNYPNFVWLLTRPAKGTITLWPSYTGKDS